MVIEPSNLSELSTMLAQCHREGRTVSGFDLCKLFVGSHGTLGVIAEARFKLRPRPEAELSVRRALGSWDETAAALERLRESPLTPVVMDLHNLDASGDGVGLVCVVAFAGSREEVAWQVDQAREQRFDAPASLEHHERFWSTPESAEPRSWSVLPSRLIEALRQLGPAPFAAHAGNGVIWHRGRLATPQEELPAELIRHTKDTFDPKHILPSLA